MIEQDCGWVRVPEAFVSVHFQDHVVEIDHPVWGFTALTFSQAKGVQVTSDDEALDGDVFIRISEQLAREHGLPFCDVDPEALGELTTIRDYFNERDCI